MSSSNFFFQTGSHVCQSGSELYVVENNFELNLLMPPPQYCDERHVPPGEALIFVIISFMVFEMII